MRTLLALLCSLAAFAAFAEDPLPPLQVIEHDTIQLKDVDPLIGTIKETLPDGSVKFTNLGGRGTELITAERIESIIHRQTAGEAVTKRGEILFAKKQNLGLRQTIEWGMKNDAVKESLALSLKVMAAEPGNEEVGELALKMLTTADAAKIETIAKGLLTANPMTEFAYAALANLYLEQKKQAELDALAKVWIDKLPSSPTANRLTASAAEMNGELRTAQEAFRKNYQNRKDLVAAIGYARTSLKLGEHAKAVKAAEDATAGGSDLTPDQVGEAKAIAGSAKLALGDTSAAIPLLGAGVMAKLPNDIMTITRYNLGVAEWLSGQVEEARKQWTQVSTPEAALALAILDHQPFAQESQLQQPKLKQIAQEYNACIALENQRYKQAQDALDPKANKRHQFLTEVANVLATSGSDASLRALQATSGDESLRWQAYGLLLARKYREAEAVLKKLPENDGYAAVYRVYAAAGLQEDSRAKELFGKVAASKNPPRDYVARLSAEYAVANDEMITEDFDWVEGDALHSGWQPSSPGTNIRIFAKDGRLMFAGKQTASADPVSRAWMLVPTSQLRAVQAVVDISKIGAAQAGIELLDEERKNGVAYGVLADNKLGWRALESGVWKEWKSLPLQVSGTQITLRFEYNGGWAEATPSDNISLRHRMGNKPFQPGNFLSVSFFGTADPGVDWSYAVDQLVVQLIGTAKPQQRGR